MSEYAAPLNIIFALRAFPVTSETFILRQVTGLLDLGHRVRVLAEWRPRDEIAHPAVGEYDLLDTVTYVHEARGGVRALPALMRVALRAPRCLPLLGRARAASTGGRGAVLDRLSGLLGWAQVDVLHSHFGDIGLQFAEPARLLGIPHVVSFYGYDVTRFPRERGDDAYGPLFASAGRVCVLSDDMRSRLVRLGCPSAILRKQHLSVDPEEYTYHDRSPPPPGEPIRLLSVARLVEKKGLAYALQALALLRARSGGDGAQLRYDIIGDGPLQADLEALASELGLRECVTFHGRRGQEAVRRAMAEAHIFLAPSVTAADGDEEGTPTVLLEAASSGLPVVSTRHSGIPETVLDGESGLLVPERDVAALAEAIASLLDDPSRWASMGLRGRRHVEGEFDANALSHELVRHYREVLVSSSEVAT